MFVCNRRMIGDPLPDPLYCACGAIPPSFEMVIEPAVLHGPAGERGRRNAELGGMLLDLGDDAVCLHARIRDICPPVCQGTFVAYTTRISASKRLNMVMTFREALAAELERTGWALKYVCSQAGVSYEQLKKVGQGKSQSTNVDDAVRVAHVFGKTLDEMLNDKLAADREAIAALWRQLSEEERALLQDAARGRSAQAREAG